MFQSRVAGLRFPSVASLPLLERRRTHVLFGDQATALTAGQPVLDGLAFERFVVALALRCALGRTRLVLGFVHRSVLIPPHRSPGVLQTGASPA